MKKQISNREEAEELAILALVFVANDAELLPRFLNITGIEANQIRQAAQIKGFLAGVLQFIAADEPTLLNFAESIPCAPQAIEQALLYLPGGEIEYNMA